MNEDMPINKTSSTLVKATTIAICLPQNPTTDTITASLGLYLGLLTLGKNVNIVCSTKIPSELELFGAEKIQTELVSEGDTLIITFPDSGDLIDKVTSNLDNNSLNLVVTPLPGATRLDPKRVKYTFSGGKIDTMVIVDNPDLTELGDIYQKNQERFKQAEIVHIGKSTSLSSTSEIVFKLLQSLNIDIDGEVATILYAGLASATANFTSQSTNAGSFEAAAAFLKMGAVKKQIRAPVFLTEKPVVEEINIKKDSRLPESQKSDTLTFGPVKWSKKPQFKQDDAPQENISIKSPETASFENLSTPDQNIEKKESFKDEETPQDWLKPKIFKGSKLI